MIWKNVASDVIQSPKTATAVGSITAALGAFLEALPDAMLAKIATLLGICLTSLLIIVQIYKLRSEKKKQRLIDMQLKSMSQSRNDDTD